MEKIFLIFVVMVCIAVASFAQISTDGSLGPAVNLTGPNYTIGQDLGKRAGNNLFHSFQDFNINTGESATFTADAAIQRVISRVTGGNISNIDGLLRSTIPNADFFLVNPAGVMFGPNTAIDINGSFSVSTADFLRFGDDNQFFSQPLENEVLSTEAPIAYGFLGAEIGDITFDQSQLAVKEGESISVVGGDIDASGSRQEASAGNINIVSVESEGEVMINNSESGLARFDIGAFMKFGKISLTDGSEINVDGEGGGAVTILGENLTLDESAITSTTTGENSGENMDIELTGSLTLLRGATILSSTEGTGDGGNISISANSIMIDSQGVAPTRITAETHLVEGGGKGGDVSINTVEFQVVNGGNIGVITLGSGDGGTLGITAETVLVDRRNSPFFTDIVAGTELNEDGGKGGDISIDTVVLLVINGGEISVPSIGSGDGGTLTIKADSIMIDRQNSQFFTGITAGTLLGKGGDIFIFR